jgi:hypothetical protein
MSRRRGLEGIGNVARSLLDFLEDLAAKTPEQSEAIAEGVLALRDQGLARYVTDDMMAKADDRYMFANTPLPMDEASRMERASEMGFDPRTFYHGSDFGYFDDFYDTTDYSSGKQGKGTIFASDNPAVANTYVDYLMNERGMYPLMVRRTYTEPTFAGGGRSWAQLPMDMPEYRSGSLRDYFPETKPNMPVFTRTSTDSIAEAMTKTPYQTAEITDVLDRGGFDLRALPVPEDKDVRLRMSKEDTDAAETWVKEMQTQSREPSTDMLVQQANRIRSRFARFDPEFKHLRNLSAAVPLSVGLAQLLNDPQSTKEDVEKYLEAINGEM